MVQSPEVSNQKETLQAPSYKYVRRNAEDGTAFALSTAQTPKYINFSPNDVQNVSEHILKFDNLVTAPGAGLFSHVHVDKLPIDAAQLLTSGGFPLAQLNNLDIASKTLRYLYTSAEEYRNRQPLVSAATVATAVLRTISHCQPATVPPSTAIAANTANSQYIRQSGAVSGIALTVATGSVGDMFSQHLNTSAANAALGFTTEVKLKDLMPATLCSVNKNFYFGGSETIQLKLLFSPYTKLGSKSDTVTHPASTPTDLVGWSISDLHLLCCVERNLHNIDLAMSAFARGVSHIVPYVEEKGSAPGTDTSGSVSYMFNLATGQNLLRVHTTAYNTANSGRLAGCVENVNGALITDIQTQIGSNLLQSQKLNVADGSWYRYLKMYYCKSALNSERMALVHWCHTDQIASASDSTMWNEENVKDSGFELESNVTQIYTANFDKTAVSAAVVSFFVFQRTLVMGPGVAPRFE